MARASTTSDVFNAVAEPRRRELMTSLASRGKRSVSELVESTGWEQPVVSKHLRVLLAVGLVTVERVGKSRFYQYNPQALKTVYDWVKQFDVYWDDQLDRIKSRAQQSRSTERLKST